MTGSSDADLIRILRAADKVLPDLKQSLEKSGLFPAPLSFRGRVKKESTIKEKISRKKLTKRGYGLDDIGDIIGIRFVTLLRADISKVVDDLFKLILSGDPLGGRSHFSDAKIIEFKQYIANAPQSIDPDTGAWIDPLTDSLKEVSQSHFGHADWPSVELRARYSSIHVALKIHASHDGVDFLIPVEVQVRSVFEDAWGEIDHKLFYEADRESLFVGQRQRMAAARHLGILKNMLDTAAEYAAIISEQDFGASSDRAPDVTANLDDAGYLERLCSNLTAHRELLDEFIMLSADKDALDLATSEGRSNLNSYSVLAEQFSDLLTRLRTNVRADDA